MTTLQAAPHPTGLTVPGKKGPVLIGDVLAARKDALAAMLPKHLAADRLIKVALFSISRSAHLQKCTAESLVVALMKSAETGLEPDGVDAALVPYGSDAQFQPMYQGLIKLALQHSKVLSVNAEVVCEGDDFDYDLGLEQKLRHKLGKKRGGVTHAWAAAHLQGGGIAFRVLTREEIDATMARSPAVKNGANTPWKTDFSAMARKTAVRRLAPFLPKTARMKAAVEADMVVEGEISSRTEDAVLEGALTGNERVKARLAAKRPTVTDVQPGETEEDAAKRTQMELDAAPKGEPGAEG